MREEGLEVIIFVAFLQGSFHHALAHLQSLDYSPYAPVDKTVEGSPYCETPASAAISP